MRPCGSRDTRKLGFASVFSLQNVGILNRWQAAVRQAGGAESWLRAEATIRARRGGKCIGGLKFEFFIFYIHLVFLDFIKKNFLFPICL